MNREYCCLFCFLFCFALFFKYMGGKREGWVFSHYIEIHVLVCISVLILILMIYKLLLYYKIEFHFVCIVMFCFLFLFLFLLLTAESRRCSLLSSASHLMMERAARVKTACFKIKAHSQHTIFNTSIYMQKKYDKTQRAYLKCIIH